ncbi:MULTISPECIES: SPOR domain-containing protein [Comamonas]|uniref:SPOR domain-containing protein n=1 Tax=Comamonas TaxID=283 RepID=UPI00051079F9|nr:MULTISPECIES: SPOR domain-containing protein [Comamonas]KGG85068.1 sporulation protein [Comamonas thiooxydans]KGG95208.1 sporulation protein [Comamonas thiooxydans]KGG96820.1 sporulation protein [Comamonas thiooxydans]KGH06190.1 sporulation protein [Comamonas thiooxydans]TZG08155.1 SPOR domain-containing protein [Comamonas thiooxydans]
MAFFNFRWPGKKDEAESVAGAKRPSRLAQGESVEAMRRRARHRLIGAAVLVLIGVVGFPLLFDTQPRPIPVNIPIEIPDQANSAPEVVPGTQVASQTAAPSGRVAANASLDDGEEVLAPSARPAAPAAAAVVPAAPVVGAAVTAAAVGTAAAVASQVKPEPKPEVKPQPKPEVKPERKPEPKPEKPKAEVKPEVKKPEAKPEPKHKPDTPKADEAARARALLEGRSTSEAAPVKEAAATNERFIVQIGAFAEVGKANEIKGKLGAGAFTQTVDTKDGKRTRVRMGPFKSREEAEKAAARAKALGLPASVFKA